MPSFTFTVNQTRDDLLIQKGTQCQITIPNNGAHSGNLFTNPRFKDSVLGQLKADGIVIPPDMSPFQLQTVFKIQKH